ncbi:hypothetical protein BH11ACT8_BH11ACT8_28120 [soil metagenome]
MADDAVMRMTSLLLVGVLALGASGCELGNPTPTGPATPAATPGPAQLDFAYEASGGDGRIDQTGTITNSGDRAEAPVLDFTPLASDGSVVAGVTVQTAFGSDSGLVVAPALTQVIDILRFKGSDAADVADVRVEIADEGAAYEDPPPANDLVVERFDGKGRPSTGRAASISVTNPYDKPVQVRIVGLEFSPVGDGGTQQFRRLTPLTPDVVTIEAGGTYEQDVDKPYSRRFFGALKAYVSA